MNGNVSWFWVAFIAVIVFDSWHPGRGPATETAYFLSEGRPGQSNYVPAFELQYSADRATQTVITYAGFVPHVEQNCTVLSAATWNCDAGMGVGSDDGDVWLGVYERPARHSVSWFSYYAHPLWWMR
jgi:hypothetical protein